MHQSRAPIFRTCGLTRSEWLCGRRVHASSVEDGGDFHQVAFAFLCSANYGLKGNGLDLGRERACTELIFALTKQLLAFSFLYSS